MSDELNMPQMGYDMKEGTIVRWLIETGSHVDKNEIVAEIETDKAVVEFQSYLEGFITQILVKEGNTVPVGEAIALVGSKDEIVATEPENVKKETETNIEESETVLSLTNDDEDNIMVSVLAEKNSPNKRTIALVNKQNYSLLQSSL